MQAALFPPYRFHPDPHGSWAPCGALFEWSPIDYEGICVMWILYAVLAAVFSALVAILTKMGLAGMNSHFATAIRTSAVMVVTWLFVWGVGVRGDALHVTGRQLAYLGLSALATGGAWLCYNLALQLGPATRVSSIDKLSIVLIAIFSALFFKESMGGMAILGLAMITVGTIVLVYF